MTWNQCESLKLLHKRSNPEQIFREALYPVPSPEAHHESTQLDRPSQSSSRYKSCRSMYKRFRRTLKKGSKAVQKEHNLDFLIPRMKLAKEKSSAYVALAESLTPEDCLSTTLESSLEIGTSTRSNVTDTDKSTWEERMVEASSLTNFDRDLFDPNCFQEQLQFLQLDDGRPNELARRIKISREEFRAVVYKDVEAAMAAAEVYREIYMDLRRKCRGQQQEEDARLEAESDLINRLRGMHLQNPDPYSASTSEDYR